ncbi:MAG TPA: flavodoxin family protein [archaeon]|nr:flavodoxin family protein [archaeon]
MKVLIAYDTKHGNTKKVAELIGEGINTKEGNEVTINNVKEIDVTNEASYDLILIGSPNHIGSHTKTVKKFITSLADSPLKGSSFAVFDTYMGKDFEKAIRKMENQVSESQPDLNKASKGLSIKVDGMKGPIADEDLPKCKEFGVKLVK